MIRELSTVHISNQLKLIASGWKHAVALKKKIKYVIAMRGSEAHMIVTVSISLWDTKKNCRTETAEMRNVKCTRIMNLNGIPKERSIQTYHV